MLKSLESKENNYPMEPLLSVKQYLMYIFEMFGIPAHVLDVESAGGIGRFDENKDNRNGNFSEAVDALVEFRSKVRKAGIAGNKVANKIMKKNKKNNATEEELKQGLEGAVSALNEVMSTCDWARDDLGKSLGIRIDDINTDMGKWTKADKL